MMKRPSLPALPRRALLRLGVGAAVVLVVAGGGAAYWRPGVRDGHLSSSGREIFLVFGRAILDGSLPGDAAARDAALLQWLQRLDDTIAGFPKATRSELAQLLGLLATGPGRRWLTGLADDWPQANVPQVQAALQQMRVASSPIKQQAYHALRDLTNAAYFSAPATWGLMGYPGPNEI